jgi:hypothetical protein
MFLNLGIAKSFEIKGFQHEIFNLILAFWYKPKVFPGLVLNLQRCQNGLKLDIYLYSGRKENNLRQKSLNMDLSGIATFMSPSQLY